jgi:hypothetical protein
VGAVLYTRVTTIVIITANYCEKLTVEAVIENKQT